jgi:hypothetical protein
VTPALTTARDTADCCNQAVTLKLQSLSIRFAAEAFVWIEDERNLTTAM